jgi:hypothetical protein
VRVGPHIKMTRSAAKEFTSTSSSPVVISGSLQSGSPQASTPPLHGGPLMAFTGTSPSSGLDAQKLPLAIVAPDKLGALQASRTSKLTQYLAVSSASAAAASSETPSINSAAAAAATSTGATAAGDVTRTMTASSIAAAVAAAVAEPFGDASTNSEHGKEESEDLPVMDEAPPRERSNTYTAEVKDSVPRATSSVGSSNEMMSSIMMALSFMRAPGG